ncbi:MAG: glucokinase [Halieaceae bacterium]
MSPFVHIVADIGGTNARFAFVEEGTNALQGIEVFPCAQFPFLVDAILTYIQREHVPQLNRVCLAVAGQVEQDWVDLPNNHWAFSRAELQRSLDVPVAVINDFSAQVLSLNALTESDLHWIGDPRPVGGLLRTIVGPGTGLGVSALLPGGEILPSEGGHVAFAPLNRHEVDLLDVLWSRYERVSVERVLSGMGLANLYWANCRLGGEERELPAAEITAGARAGDSHCCRAVRDFVAILGSVAGDMALMTGADDGVYLSGGILPKMLDLIDEGLLLERFQDKGRYRAFNGRLPLAVVLAEHPGLIGCVEALQRSFD